MVTRQGLEPDPGNLAVRDSRGASANVRHGETVNPFRNRKSGNGNPLPTARRGRFLSRPSQRSLYGTSMPCEAPSTSSKRAVTWSSGFEVDPTLRHASMGAKCQSRTPISATNFESERCVIALMCSVALAAAIFCAFRLRSSLFA